MTTTVRSPDFGFLTERIRNILFTPEAEWTKIEAEPASAQSLFLGYACVLAAIGPLARLIGSQLFGYPAFFSVFRPTLIGALSSAVVGYLLSLAALFLLALVIDALAPTFGGVQDRISALKVATYSSTAAWIADGFNLLPPVSALAIIGLYSLYLLYLGLPKLMKTPQDKALAYVGVIIIVYLIFYMIVASIAVSIASRGTTTAVGLH